MHINIGKKEQQKYLDLSIEKDSPFNLDALHGCIFWTICLYFQK